jgi:hypothetical protein
MKTTRKLNAINDILKGVSFTKFYYFILGLLIIIGIFLLIRESQDKSKDNFENQHKNINEIDYK